MLPLIVLDLIMNITEAVKRLRFPLGQYVVIGSGTLAALGLRKAEDIDISVLPELYNALRRDGDWDEEERYGKIFLKRHNVEINPQLHWDGYPTTVEEAIASALVIEGVPFMSIEELMRFKRALGREKD